MFDWCSEASVEWLFNHICIGHSIPRSWLSFLPSGSSSVETVMYSVNKLFRNLPTVHLEYILLCLDALQQKSIGIHCAAFTHKAVLPMRSEDIGVILCATFRSSADEWASIVACVKR